MRLCDAGITQLVECDLAKVEVAGSSPVSRSTLLIELSGCLTKEISAFLLSIFAQYEQRNRSCLFTPESVQC